MYWDRRLIAPGASREMGFAYGLGDVAAGEGGGKLGLSVGGAFTPGGEFSVTAYVNNPVARPDRDADAAARLPARRRRR